MIKNKPAAFPTPPIEVAVPCGTMVETGTPDKKSPLAARIRSMALDEVVGQKHIIGKGNGSEDNNDRT